MTVDRTIRVCGVAADFSAFALAMVWLFRPQQPGAELQTFATWQLAGAAALTLLGLALGALARMVRSRADANTASPCSSAIGVAARPLVGHQHARRPDGRRPARP